jgi:hypothetical protein
MLKPSKSTLTAAFKADPVLQRYDEDIAEYRQLEAARINAVRAHLNKEWAAYRELRKAAKAANAKVRHARYRIHYQQRGLRIVRKPLRTIASKIQTRKRLLTRRVEKDFLRQQQLEFRRQFNTLSQKQDIKVMQPGNQMPVTVCKDTAQNETQTN